MKKISISKPLILDVLFVLLIIFNSNSVYSLNANFNIKMFNYIFPVGLFFLILFYLFFSWKKILNIENLKFVHSFIILLVICLTLFYINFSIYNHGIIQRFFYFIVTPLLIYIYLFITYSNNRIKMLMNVFCEIVCTLAIVSLIFWIGAQIKVPYNSKMLIEWGSIHDVYGYFNIDFLTQGTIRQFGLDIYRNTGVFAEAPMYSFVLSIALTFNFIYLRNYSRYMLKNIIFIVTIITTTSTTGIIVIVFLLMFQLFIFIMRNYNFSRKQLLISLFIVFLFIFVIVSIILINKFRTFGGDNGSVNIRTDDFISGFKAFSLNPLFGNGYGNTYAININMQWFRYLPGGNNGYSSGIMTVLAYGGILNLIPYLIPGFIAIKLRYYKEFFIFLVLMFILINTIVSSMPLYLFSIIYLYYICKLKENLND